MNSLPQSIQKLSQRDVEFLLESEALANPSKEVSQNLSKSELAKALREMLNDARNHTPLTVESLKKWNGWITQDGRKGSTSIEEELSLYVKDLNTVLKVNEENIDEVKSVELIGDFYHRLLNMHPWHEGNRRLSRFIANYIVAWFSLPLIVFRKTESKELDALASNKILSRLYMGKKIQEAIYNANNEVISLGKHYGMSAEYVNPPNGTILVEWHRLMEAIKQWKQEIGSDQV